MDRGGGQRDMSEDNDNDFDYEEIKDEVGPLPDPDAVQLKIPPELMNKGVKNISCIGSALQIQYNDKTFTTTLVRKDPTKTMKMFDKMVDGTIDHYLKEQIWFCISENWAILIPDPEDGVSTTSAKSAKMIAPNVAGLVIDLAVEKTKVFFKDQYDTHYALVTMSDHDEVIRLESGKFKRYLAKLYYDTYDNRVANTDAIGNAIQILQAKAEYSDTIPLSLRVAKSEDGSIYYDLTDAKYRSVKIDPIANKWDIIDDTPILFTRYNQSPQVLPSRDYEDGVFDKFIGLTNIKEQQDRLLLKVYIISLFIPEIAHVMLATPWR